MARKKVGPFGAVDRYVEEMSKPERVTNYAREIRGYIADKEALNLTKYKLLLYQQSLKEKASRISEVINEAVADYVKKLGPIPRHRKQQKALTTIIRQQTEVEKSVGAVKERLGKVAEALAALATAPAV
jgi:hypothetical protein